MYYDPANSLVHAIGTIDQDYNSAYYYTEQITTTIRVNGNLNGNGEFGFDVPRTGHGTSDVIVPVNPGDYAEATTTASLDATYYTYQVVRDCVADCGSYYDPFSYNGFLGSATGIDQPTFSTTIWAPIIIVTGTVGQLITLGTNGTSLQIPGALPNTYDVKLRTFIPPAWIRGPAPFSCWDSRGLERFIFAGDNRSFDPFADSVRFSTHAVVSSSGVNLGQGLDSHLICNSSAIGNCTSGSTRYAGDALNADNYTLTGDSVLDDCHLTDQLGSTDLTALHTDVYPGSLGGTIVHLYGNGKDPVLPLQALVAGITYDDFLTLSGNSYTLNYQHDCYPAFEIYINNKPVYQWKPDDNSAINLTSCLNGFNQRHGTENGSLAP